MVRLEKFEALEKRLDKLIKHFSLLKREKDEVGGVLKKKSSEHQEIKRTLEKLYKERYLLRSKLDALIDKLESLEHSG